MVFLGARESIDEIAVENATQTPVLVTEYPCELDVGVYIETHRSRVRGPSFLAGVPRIPVGQQLVIPADRGGTPLGKCIAVVTNPDSQWSGAPIRDGYLHRISESDGSLVVTATQDIGVRTRFDIGKVLPLLTILGLALGIGYVLSIVLDFWGGNFGKETRTKA